MHAYVLEGETSFLDADSGQRHPVGTGDKLIISAGTLHAEGEIRDRVVYYIGLSEAVPREEFLKLRSPEERPS